MLALVPLLVAAAGAAPITHGERLEWAVTWMGVSAGSAWATTAVDAAAAGADVTFEAGATSAPWLAGLYPIDDHLRSEWRPGAGSRRYVTRFREGDFQQDQDVRLDGRPITVARSQRFDEGWRTWTDTQAAGPGVEDPVSAFFRIREEAGPVGERVRYDVWGGRGAKGVEVWTAGVEVVDGRGALRVEVLTAHTSGDFESKMTVWVSDDADRVPLRAEVRTRAGPVRVTLVRRVVE